MNAASDFFTHIIHTWYIFLFLLSHTVDSFTLQARVRSNSDAMERGGEVKPAALLAYPATVTLLRG